VEWIGEIPEGWEIKKLKYVFREHSGNGFPNEMQGNSDGTIPFYKVSDLNGPEIFVSDSNNYVTADAVNAKNWNLVPTETILTAKIGESLRKNHRKICKTECIIDNNCLGLEPIGISSNYAYFLLKTVDFDTFVNPGAVPSISMDKLRNFVLPLSYSEQTAIASFLDRKTAEIAQLIANKEMLIALYEEEKAAIINRAVTRGLDPKVKTKPAGVDWLGDIPGHWEVKRLKYLISRLESGVSVNATDYPANGDEFGILKTSCVYDYNFNPNENKAIWPQELERAKVLPRKGSIIISRMNTPDLVGASGYVEKDYHTLFLPDRLWQTVFWQDSNIDAKWLSCVFKCSSFRKLLSITATGTSPSMKNLGQEEFLNITIPFMDIGEQTTIVDHIETECSRLDTIIDKFKKQIELFKEYRTTLISEVVTGKIDVREEVAA
jgi:type I restriction enzyme S subunit